MAASAPSYIVASRCGITDERLLHVMEEDGYRFPSPSMSSHLTGSNAVNLVMRQMLQNAKLGEQEAITRTTSKFKDDPRYIRHSGREGRL